MIVPFFIVVFCLISLSVMWLVVTGFDNDAVSIVDDRGVEVDCRRRLLWVDTYRQDPRSGHWFNRRGHIIDTHWMESLRKQVTQDAARRETDRKRKERREQDRRRAWGK